MSDLSSTDKLKLEKFLGMKGGYVLDFSNRTFEEFIYENTYTNIYDEKYNYSSGSKANRLRAFWDQESNNTVGKLISDLLEYWETESLINNREIDLIEQDLFDECNKISEKLKQNGNVENIDVIEQYLSDGDFSKLAKQIRESIYNNEPEVGLDRLHTFLVKYTRMLCKRHGISYDEKKALHSLFGEYVKYLGQNNLIESEMTKRILKSSISILDSFNDIRNNRSLAHDNRILNYHESILISNNVLSIIKFIEFIENKNLELSEQNELNTDWENLSF